LLNGFTQNVICSENLASKFAFKCNLYRYIQVGAANVIALLWNTYMSW
jgi:hypothetical protein